MRVTLNGQLRDLGEHATVAEAVEAAGADPAGRGLAVAVDGQVVSHTEWSATLLEDGQRVEVLQAVQGG